VPTKGSQSLLTSAATVQGFNVRKFSEKSLREPGCSADWQSAVSRIGNLRHSQLPAGATVPRLLKAPIRVRCSKVFLPHKPCPLFLDAIYTNLFVDITKHIVLTE